MKILTPWIGNTCYYIDDFLSKDKRYRRYMMTYIDYDSKQYKLLIITLSNKTEEIVLCDYLFSGKSAQLEANKILIEKGFIFCDRRTFQKLQILK
jgi:hypothetical protein